ncbi:MAG: hypothetical protein Q7K55_05830 [Candidatus Levybacteria bacterium]|nr:hypothetical protein [Candidatus Levybacteria bacterium]
MENKFNKNLIELLKVLNEVLEEKPPLRVNENEVILMTGERELVKITNKDILVANQSFKEKIRANEQSGSDIDLEKFKGFLKEIQGSIVRLNHLGVSYFCQDLNTETLVIKNSVKKNDFKLYKEESGNNDRWLFIGDLTIWDSPLFEIVLSKGDKGDMNFWAPHFQIDIDTKMTIEEIRKVCNKYLGKGFIKWEMNIPDYGVVLAMGILDNINGKKIALGLGTTIRQVDYHRKEILKVI